MSYTDDMYAQTIAIAIGSSSVNVSFQTDIVEITIRLDIPAFGRVVFDHLEKDISSTFHQGILHSPLQELFRHLV